MKILPLFIASVFSITAFAANYDFEYQNVYYRVTSAKSNYEKSLEVVGANADANGEVQVPKTFTLSNVYYTVKGIGDEAFKNDTGLTGLFFTFPNPESVYSFGVNIGNEAFSGCTSLKNISVGVGTELPRLYLLDFNIGKRSFEKCNALTSFFDGSELTGVTQHNCVMGDSAFYNCFQLRQIGSPNAKKWVNSLGKSVFYKSGISNFNIDGGDLIEVPAYAFYGCSNLDSIYIKSNTFYLRQDAFSRSGIRSISLPQMLFKIESGVFANTPLASISVPGSVTRIGQQAFFACTSLKEVVLEDGVSPLTLDNNKYSDGIGGGLFEDCSRLERATIGRNLTIARTYDSYNRPYQCAPFYRSSGSSLSELTLTAAVSQLPDYLLSGCSKLTALNVMSAVPPTAKSGTFNSYDKSNLVVTVPEGTRGIYAKAPYWKVLFNYITQAGYRISIDVNPTECLAEINNEQALSAVVNRNSSVNMNLTPNSGFNLDSILVNDSKVEPVNVDGSYSFSIDSINGDISCKAFLSPKRISLFVFFDENTKLRQDWNFGTPIILDLEAGADFDLHSVTYNEEEFPIEDQKRSHIEISNPTSDVELYAVTVSNMQTEAEDIAETPLKVIAKHGGVCIKGVTSDDVSRIYNISGNLIYQGHDSEISLPGNDVYILKIRSQTYKFAL